ncbi:MAG: lipid A deacylase LpxR family protein [Rhodovibrionaceae bacterium]
MIGLFALAMGSLCATPALAQQSQEELEEAEENREHGTFSLIFENDIFANTDRNYTNGIRAEWLSTPMDIPEWVTDAARAFPLFPDDGIFRASYAIGQSMYTPKDITRENPSRDDRPYAGWLYGAIGLIAENGQRLDQIELTLGIVGPASGAAQTQKAVHKIIDSPDPKGWDSQLKNEPGVILTYQRSWRGFISRTSSGYGFDLTPHAGGALGNVYTYANAGATLRLGKNLLLDYGPPRIKPSISGSGFFVPYDGTSWYFFAGVEGRAVARNIFLDGNSFRDSRSVDRNIFVGDVQFGFALTVQNVRVSYTHVFRTPEFDGQDDRDGFGALSLSIRY